MSLIFEHEPENIHQCAAWASRAAIASGLGFSYQHGPRAGPASTLLGDRVESSESDLARMVGVYSSAREEYEVGTSGMAIQGSIEGRAQGWGKKQGSRNI